MRENSLRKVWHGVAVAVLVLAPLRSAAAQERPGSWYLMTGVAVVHQDGLTGESSQIYVAAPGGTSRGWWVAGGTFASSRVSVEGELAATGTMLAREPSRYGYTYNEERRDLFLGANVRLHFGSVHKVHIEPVGGIGLVFHQAWSQDDFYQYWLMPQQQVMHSPRVQDATQISMSLSGGLDVRVGGPHVAVVPSFRVRWYGSSDALQSRWPGGHPTWTISGGAAVRIDF
jgi:hypothetical protein